jgi:hypothetical protein
MAADCFPANERGIKSASVFPEPNTAVYDGILPFSYFCPTKVSIEKMPAPDAKYYQHLTKRHWDVSATENYEMRTRTMYFQAWFYGILVIFVHFFMQKEKKFAGTSGSDGFWALLPKGHSEYFS